MGDIALQRALAYLASFAAGLICRSQVAGRGLQVIVSPIQKVS